MPAGNVGAAPRARDCSRAAFLVLPFPISGVGSRAALQGGGGGSALGVTAQLRAISRCYFHLSQARFTEIKARLLISSPAGAVSYH